MGGGGCWVGTVAGLARWSHKMTGHYSFIPRNNVISGHGKETRPARVLPAEADCRAAAAHLTKADRPIGEAVQGLLQWHATSHSARLGTVE
jgi:hypothetical protein